MTKFLLFISMTVLLAFCQAKSSKQEPKNAKQLYEEGMDILYDRIDIQNTDSVFAKVLNKRAVKRFSAAYEADTSFRDAAFYASECSMYARDYQECIYWTTKLMRLDTSQQNVAFCTDRIKNCEEQLSK